MKKLHSHILLIALLFCSFGLRAADNKNDSLLLLLQTSTSDSLKVNILHRLYLENDSIAFAFDALKIAEDGGYKRGMAISLLDIGRHYYFERKEDQALTYLIKAIKIAEGISDKKILIGAYRYVGFIYRGNDPVMAENFYNKSLRLAQETGDELSASYAMSAIGNIYEGVYKGSTRNNRKALDYYLSSLDIRERKGSLQEIASSLNETSRIYDVMGEYDKGLELRKKGLAIAEKAGSTENIVFLCNVLGNDYSFRLHDYKKGIEYQTRAYNVAKTQTNNFEVLFEITRGLGRSYHALGDLRRSNDFYQEAMIAHDSVRSKEQENTYTLSGLKHDLEKELDKQKQLLKDSEILKEKANAEKQTTIRNASLIGFGLVLVLVIIVIRANRQKQHSNSLLDIKNQRIENAYKTLEASEKKFKLITETITDVFYLYNIVEKKYEYISPNCSTMLGLPDKYFYEGKSPKVIVHPDDLDLVVDANIRIDSGLAYDVEYRIVVNGMTKWVAEKSSPIFDPSGRLVMNSGICRDITNRKSNEEKLRKKSKDITDSILYAKTIQDAILVPKEVIAKTLPDFFILSKPKDIVGGDFYFYKETEHGIFAAVADCTGHGVPAGFMSMIGSAFLNEILNENNSLSPGKVLGQLRQMIITSLNQRVGSESKDGMDIALIHIDKEFKSVRFAGAFNPLYLIRNGELQEIKANMFPVGIHVVEVQDPFTEHEIELRKGDALYIFSDGYADQFGGPDGRKFLRKQMQKLLVSVQDKKMAEQKKIVYQTFVDWKGNNDQVDDVMVMGIRI